MKKFVKNYIAKGKKVEGIDIVKVHLKVEDILKHQHEFKGEQYISIEVAKLTNPDRFGNEYTVYVNTIVEVQDPVKKTRKSTKKEPVESDDLPF